MKFTQHGASKKSVMREDLKPGAIFRDDDGDLNIVTDENRIICFPGDSPSPFIRTLDSCGIPLSMVHEIIAPGTKFTFEA